MGAGEKLQWRTDSGNWMDATVNGTDASISHNFTASTVQLQVLDNAGNTGAVSSLEISADSTAPSLNSTSVNGNILTLALSEPIKSTTGFVPTAADFSFSDASVSVTGVNVSGSNVLLTLSNTYSYNQVVPSLSYTNSADATDIQDGAGNELPSFSTRALMNVTPDNTIISAANLNNLTDLSVNSNIVLSISNASVQDNAYTLGSGKITINNAGLVGSGFRGENIDNDIEIDVATGRTVINSTPVGGTLTSTTLTATSSVTLNNGKLVINPAVDLDFGNQYSITADAGVVLANVGGINVLSQALTSGVSFSTVTPDASVAATGALSKIVNNDGTTSDSYRWVDLEGRGTVQPESSAPITASGQKFAFVWTDYNTAPSTLPPVPFVTNVQMNNSNVQINSLGIDDLFYLDNHGVIGNLSSWSDFAEDGSMFINATAPNLDAHFSWVPTQDNLRALTYLNLDNSWGTVTTVSITVQELINRNVVLAG